MKYITSRDLTTGEEVKISYADYGKGIPVVLIHGWPLNKHQWEYQVNDLVEAGCRVIKYDRRGFGYSDKPWDGYDYDSLTDDLHALILELGLHDAVLVGFSMGGGEVVRYLSKYGSDRIAKIVLISSIIPYLLKTDDNPGGVDASVFAGIQDGLKNDRIGFLEDFGKKFFGVNLVRKPISHPLLNYYLQQCSMASPRATKKCAESFAQTDFRDELENIRIPVMIIHGDEDKTVPIESSSDITAKKIPGALYKIYEGAPHGLFYTEKEQLNEDLISFIKEGEFVSELETESSERSR